MNHPGQSPTPEQNEAPLAAVRGSVYVRPEPEGLSQPNGSGWDRLGPPPGAPGIGPEGAEPSGLVLEGRTQTEPPPDPNGVGWSLRDDECPLEGAHSFDRTTGEIVWRPTCKNARCPRCSRQVSAQTFALARRALDGRHSETVPGLPVSRERQVDRVRFITLTRAPEGWEATRQAMNVWLQYLRRLGYEMHVLWVVEQGSETGMKHIHAIQWGDFIPKEHLSESWPYGMTQIEGARAATNYLSKGVVKYVAKGLDADQESLVEHMNLNGGRAAHWSRSFFAGDSRDAFRKRNPLPGVYFVEVHR